MSPDPGTLSRPAPAPELRLGGLFVAVVGPSGAGKDTLIAHAARQLAADDAIRFARRIVTREANEAAEDHDSLSREAFEAGRAKGEFCLTWAAHGLGYALPHGVMADITAGRTVVANVSRRSLDDAASLFGPIRVVEITARPELLMARIAARGRESPQEVADRLARQVSLTLPAETAGFLRIDNSDGIDVAADLFVRHLRALRSA